MDFDTWFDANYPASEYDRDRIIDVAYKAFQAGKEYMYQNLYFPKDNVQHS